MLFTYQMKVKDHNFKYNLSITKEKLYESLIVLKKISYLKTVDEYPYSNLLAHLYVEETRKDLKRLLKLEAIRSFRRTNSLYTNYNVKVVN